MVKDMVKVAGGTFLMGSEDPEGFPEDGEGPVREVALDPFQIDRFAVTLEVRADGTLNVREAITFDFKGSHQGIFRTIPVRYERRGFDFALRIDEVHAFDERDIRLLVLGDRMAVTGEVTTAAVQWRMVWVSI